MCLLAWLGQLKRVSIRSLSQQLQLNLNAKFDEEMAKFLLPLVLTILISFHCVSALPTAG